MNNACMFGMTAKDKDGEAGPALKPTRWVTNAPYLARHLNRRCRGTRSAHAQLLSGKAAQAAVCPPELVEAIVRGLQTQRERDHRTGRAELPLSSAIEQAMKPSEAEDGTYGFPNVKLQGSREAYGENTGELLDEKLVRKAILEEFAYFKP